MSALTLEGMRSNPAPLYPPGPITGLWMWGMNGADLATPEERLQLATNMRATFRAYHGAEEKMMPYLRAADAIEGADWKHVGILMRLEEDHRWRMVLEKVEADRRQHEQLLAIAGELEMGRRVP